MDALSATASVSPRLRFDTWRRSLTPREARAVESVPAALEFAIGAEAWRDLEWERSKDQADRRV